MSKKFIIGCTLMLTIGFLIMGIVSRSSAQDYKGVQMSSGVIIDGKFSEIASGTVGANREKYESLNYSGTIYFVLAGVTGFICVVSFIGRKKE